MISPSEQPSTTVTATRRNILTNAFLAIGGLIVAPSTFAEAETGIFRSEEAIRQEIAFKASRQRVYKALTDTSEFAKLTQLSAAGMSLGAEATDISREQGGAFKLFGGHIVGRHIELVPNSRVVQAWRAGNWEAGIYSIASFVLEQQGAMTKMMFTHTGFPKGQAEHLAEGWRSNYWEPLEKLLAK